MGLAITLVQGLGFYKELAGSGSEAGKSTESSILYSKV